MQALPASASAGIGPGAVSRIGVSADQGAVAAHGHRVAKRGGGLPVAGVEFFDLSARRSIKQVSRAAETSQIIAPGGADQQPRPLDGDRVSEPIACKFIICEQFEDHRTGRRVEQIHSARG